MILSITRLSSQTWGKLDSDSFHKYFNVSKNKKNSFKNSNFLRPALTKKLMEARVPFKFNSNNKF